MMARGVVVPIPSWLVKLVVGSIVTAMVTGAVAWEGKMSARSHVHETRISVLEEHQEIRDKEIDRQLEDIKKGQNRMEDKLDRALRRR